MPIVGRTRTRPAAIRSADSILAMIGKRELVAAGDLVARDSTLRPKPVLESLHRLVLRGELYYAGSRFGPTGAKQRLFTRNKSKAVSGEAPPPYMGAESFRPPAESDLPIVALLTPPVPKFRILRTQVVGVR